MSYGLRRAGIAISAAAVTAIAVATLTPNLGPRSYATLACIVCGDRGWADAAVNVILFAPLGVGLAVASVRLRRILLAGVLLSVLVEFAQLTLVAGRDPSIGDVLFNAVGTWLGVGLVSLVIAIRRVDDRVAAYLSLGAALNVVLAVLVTAWLLQPSLPDSEYWGQWTPRFDHLEWYEGRILSARIAGREVPLGRIADSDHIRASLSGGAPTDIRFLAGPPVTGLAPIFSIYDERQREILLIGPDRADLVVRTRLRARSLRLDQPDLRLPGAMADLAVGVPYEIRVWSPSAGQWCAAGPQASRCGLGFSAGMGWAVLLYPEALPAWIRHLLAAGWIAALTLPAGFLLRHRLSSAAALGVVVFALGALPTIAHLRPTRLVEWCGAALGLGAGITASYLARRQQPGGETRGTALDPASGECD